MNCEVRIGRRNRTVKITSTSSRLEFSLDGQGVPADVVEVEPNVFSVLFSGEAFEVRVHKSPQGVRIYVDGREYGAELNDPRQWRRNAGGASSTAGRQSVFAPMPGKVVRVLVQPGARVTLGQGLLVVEAMKMQNEIKSPKEGTVDRINAEEGKAVNAGEVLAVIT